MGTLYVVSTPLGNLEDISLRALRILSQVALIAAEDTRTTRKLLSHYHIATKLVSFHQHSQPKKLDHLLSLLREKDVALVSEAGTPGISDPGYQLIRGAIAASVPVVPVPGPSALVAALSVSGLPTHQFIYLGFLPRHRAERRRMLASVAAEPRTIVAFEAPHRLLSSLRDILQELGNRPMAIARELTKVHEEVVRGTVEEVLARFASQPPLGELTLVIAGAEEKVPGAVEPSALQQELAALLRAGLNRKEAVAQVAARYRRPRREVYRLSHGSFQNGSA